MKNQNNTLTIPFFRTKNGHILRIIFILICSLTGFAAPFLHIHFLIITLLFLAGIVSSYFNYKIFTTKFDLVNAFFLFVSGSFYLEYYSDIHIAWISILFVFFTMYARLLFYFSMGDNNHGYKHAEKYLWVLSVISVLLCIYLNSAKQEYFLFFSFFLLPTFYTWVFRIAEIKEYRKIRFPMETGRKASDFTLYDQYGNAITLSSFSGKSDVLLLFVRGDWCPGCHIMIRTYYKYREKFKEKGVVFLVIGPDPQGVNREMMERLGVDFIMLADDTMEVTGRYGVQADGKLPSVEYSNGFPLPAAFIIDKQGIIRYTTKPENPGSFLRPDSILAVLDGLQSQEQNYEIFEETFQTIVNQANEGIMVLDIVEGKIVHANQCLCDILEYTTQNILYKSIFDFCPPDFLQESAKFIAEAWEKKGLLFRMQMQTVSGVIIPTECSARVIPFGKISAMVLYIRDIRERIEMENQIIQQSHIIEQRNKDMLDSITYAQRIQTATLPSTEEWKSFSKDTFIYFRPKDIVSGDFYWLNFDREINKVFFALGDCTGHGVPGAFMSMLSINLLNHIIDDKGFKDPLLIIQELDNNIQKTLKQEEYKGNDGLDCVLFSWDKKTRKLEYVLAGRPLWIGMPETNELKEIKADKFPIGGIDYQEKFFSKHIIELPPNTKLFFFSDGIADQMGEITHKKYGTKKLREFVKENLHLSLSAFSDVFIKETEEWKGNHYQLDDMTFIAIEL
jgi:PAS domain S-box-containing protein